MRRLMTILFIIAALAAVTLAPASAAGWKRGESQLEAKISELFSVGEGSKDVSICVRVSQSFGRGECQNRVLTYRNHDNGAYFWGVVYNTVTSETTADVYACGTFYLPGQRTFPFQCAHANLQEGSLGGAFSINIGNGTYSDGGFVEEGYVSVN